MPSNETCPDCRRTVDVDPGFSAWCEHCGWNVAPQVPHRPAGQIERIQLALGRRFGRSILAEIRSRPAHRPRMGLATVGAFAASAIVYGLALLLAVAGGLMIVGNAPTNIFGLFIGATLLGLAWLMRPRARKLEERVPTHGRRELPELFRLVDGIAAALRLPSVDVVAISPDFTAGYGRFGWRQRRVLFVGLPLLLSLDPQERVAVIGHELGHGANGDPGRSLFVGGALSALVELWAALEPDELLPVEEGLFGYLRLPFRLVQLGLARIVLTGAAVLLLLLHRDSQRAEYYADALGARAGGRRAALAALALLHAAPLIARMTWLGQTADPVAAVLEKVRRLPQRERERLRRVGRLEGSRLDYTHPPTAYRIEALEARSAEPAAYVLGLGASDALDRELERFRRPIGQRIVDEYLAAVSR